MIWSLPNLVLMLSLLGKEKWTAWIRQSAQTRYFWSVLEHCYDLLAFLLHKWLAEWRRYFPWRIKNQPCRTSTHKMVIKEMSETIDVMILSLAETLLEEILLYKILNSFKPVINPLSMASILYPGSKVSNVLSTISRAGHVSFQEWHTTQYR